MSVSGIIGEKGNGWDPRTVNSRCVYPSAFMFDGESRSLGNREGKTYMQRQIRLSVGYESEDLL